MQLVDISLLNNNLIEIIEFALDDNNIPVYFEDGNAAKLEGTIITLKIISNTRAGHPYIYPVDENGDQKTQNVKKITLSINGYGPGSSQNINNIMDSFDLTTTYQECYKRYIGYRGNGGFNDLSDPISNRIEERANVDLFLSYATPYGIDAKESVGLIESVELESDINNINEINTIP